ncbi:MAG: DUF3849 domain-containing protein [Clostridiales bacterium]|nr:DUF3849 domain-containing protein [Clostridiales bacterium]
MAGLTKDDIDSVFLKADEPTKDIKYRVYRQFNSLQYRVNRNKRSKSNIDFLKNEYGTYSAAHDFPDGTKGNIYFNNKEMSIVKQGTFSDPDIIFRWADVESRINTLVRENRYFNDEEKEYYPKYLESIKAPQYEIDNYMKDVRRKFIADNSALPPSEKRDSLALRLSDFIRDLDNYERNLLENVGRTDLANISADEMEKHLGEPETVQQLIDFLNDVQWKTPDVYSRGNSWHFRQELAELYPMRYICNLYDVVYIDSSKFEVLEAADDNFVLRNVDMPLDTRFLSLEELQEQLSKSTANDKYKRIVIEEPSHNQQINIDSAPNSKQTQDKAVNTNINASSMLNQSFSQDIIDLFLINGSNTDNGRMMIATELMKQKPIEEIAESLKTIYHGGFGIQAENKTVSAWYADDGIHLSSGRTARYDNNAQIISWGEAAERIGQLLLEGKFATNVELAEADSFEIEQIARKIIDLYRDLSDEGKNQNLLPSVSSILSNSIGYPDMVKTLAEKLNVNDSDLDSDLNFRKLLYADFTAFKNVYKQNRSVLRFHYHNIDDIDRSVRELELPRFKSYKANMSAVPSIKMFITDDEINADFTRGSGVSGGKIRIYNYFSETHTSKERADFLKNEYGTGGHSPAFSGAVGSSEWHDSKGMRYSKNNCEDVKFNWSQAVKRIEELIENGRYLTEKEKNQVNEITNEEPVPATEQSVNNEFMNDSDKEEIHNENLENKEENITYVPLYKNTPSYAHEHNELDLFRASNRENRRCRAYIEKTISENFDGMYLDPTVIDDAIEQFGVDRVSYVLAATVKAKDYDERFSSSNRKWADTVDISFRSPNSFSEIINSHSAILDGFINLFRKELERELVIEQEQAVDENSINKNEYSLMSNENEISFTEPVADFVENISLEFTGNISDIQQMKDFILSLGRTVHTYSDTRIEVFADSNIKNELSVKADELNVSVNELPTITCEFSESGAFENGRVYSVAEFDKLMREADKKFAEGKNEAIQFYGSVEAWNEAAANNNSDNKFTEFIGYDKVEFTVNMPDGSKITERQDIGDGYGGVIDYLKHFEKSSVIEILEAAVTGGINQADLGKENSAQLKQDNTDLDNDIIEFAAKYDDIYKDLYDNYDTPEKMDSIKNEYNAALKAYDEVAANDPNNYHSKYVSYREDEFTSDRELAAFVFAVCGGIEQFKDTSYYKNYISLQNALENHETIYFNESADETIPASWENAYGNKRLVYDNYSDNGIGYELIADMIIEPKVDGLILYALKDTYSIDDVRDFIESFNLSVDYSRLENAAQLEQDKTEKIEPAFNENTIYDVLLAVRDQHNFEFGNAEVIDDKIVNDKCKMLAENIKGIIDEKSLYPDWFNNQNIRSQLGIDIKINLIKNGYPAQHSTEVFNKIMEQIDIGGFEKNSNKSDLDIGINQTDLKKENFIQVDQDNSAQIEHSYNVNISKTKLDNGTKNVDKSYILQNALENYKDVYFKETGNEIIYDWVRKYFGEKGLHISPDEDYDSKYEFMLIGNDDTLEEFKNIDEVKQYIINHNLSVDFDRLETTVTKPENFRITDYDFISGNAKERFRDNINAIKTLFTIESEGRQATPKEQEILAKYVGWGGLALAFDEREDAWVNEYKELKELLPEDLYKSARSTVNDSFYTPPVVINATYKAIENMGFKEGKILEPSMGVGNFFGMLPENLNGSKLYGVEIDDLSGRIAKQLYPNAHIQIKGFEKTAFASNSFDVAIGNVPFGTQYINDKDFKGSNLIHDYFFKKALDKVRPGGVVAFITSIGTLDKKDSSVRKYLAERADLLGALRLPDNTFKKNAGTDVASDIIFLQKRETPRNLEKDGIPDWVNLSQNQDNITMNSYFINNPEMVLGEMKEVSGRFGPTTVCRPFENADLAELLEKAVSNIKGSIEPYEIEKDSLPPEIKSEVDPEGHRNFCYDVIDGDVYYRENDIMTKTDFNKIRYKDAPERMKGMIEISHCVQELIRLQLENYSPEAISRQQDILNVLYDSFTEKYGLLSDRVNSLLFKEDDTSPLLQSLENINEKGEFISKADIFSKRTIIPHVNIASVDTASEALAVSISEKAKVDLDFMAELCSKNKEDIIEELEGIIFENPLTKQYETADEYLSGNVREKLNTAREFAATDSKYKSNVTALEQAQPADLEPSEISVQLGSTWIPAKYYEQFMYELLQTPKKCRSEEITNTSYRHIRNPFVCSGCNCDNTIIAIDYDNHSASFAVSNKKSYFADSNNVLACKTFGTGRRNAYEIIEASLNLKTVQIFDTFTDELGKKHQVLNEKETLLAQEKQNIIKNKFKEWIFDDAERTAELCELYNKKFNSTRPREYDGSHINFVGMNPEIELREHQQNAIAHTLYGGNTLLAHSVGAGKSATRS